MAKRIVSLVLALAFMLAASACSSIYESEYSYSEKYTENEGESASQGTDIKNYTQLTEAILDLVGGAAETGEFRFSNYSGSVGDDLASACYEVKNQSPLGAYAVDTLTYDLSRIVSYYSAIVSITYKRTEEDIKSVVQVNGITELKNNLRQGLENSMTKLVLKVYSSAVNEDYISGLIHQDCLSDALLVAREPTVRVTAYPSEGANRIYVVNLDYGAESSELLAMKTELVEAVKQTGASVTGNGAAEMALSCARNLSASCALDEDADNAASAYGALVERKAGSEGIALAYEALCGSLGIECQVVEGTRGDYGKEKHYWNIIGIDGEYYHVDVSRIAEAGAESVFLRSDAQMWGPYLWETADYPHCAGSLTYSDAAGKNGPTAPAVPAVPATPQPSPEESPAPGETSENIP